MLSSTPRWEATMRSHRILASVLPWAMAGVGYQSSVLNDPLHFNVSPDTGATDLTMPDADAARLDRAQVKRDRKNAKRLRHAKGGNDA